jgi:hypothetical protein
MTKTIRGGVFFGLLTWASLCPARAASAAPHSGAFSDTLIQNAAAGALNNVVVDVQSIADLPEPRSIVLFGTTLLIICGVCRRKFARTRQSAN